MRRFASLVILLFFTIPFGLSVVGCGHKAAPTEYCNGGDTGPTAGELSNIVLSPNFAINDESLNYGQIGSALSATGYDCKGSTVSVRSFTYATTDMSFADINPTNGEVCGGTWNRNSGGGVADYTTCTPPTAANQSKYLAFITATASGVVSNAIPVYIHPVVTSIVFGRTQGCSTSTFTSTDPDTGCFPLAATTVVTASLYDGVSCVSQNLTAQIVARIYAGSTNITQASGHLNFGTEGASGIVTLDQNGVATAGLPGSVALTAELSNSSSASSIGFFSTCPPAHITLTAVGQSSSSAINVPINNTQPFTASVTDTAGNPLSLGSGLLEFESTSPQTIPASTSSGAGAVVPAFPGTATVTAICQPPTCNPAPLSQLGVNGNGKSVTSNGIQVTATGTSSTLLYAASTSSQYLFVQDFSTGLAGQLVKLPFVPNSLAISQDGSAIYMGSAGGLMTLATGSNTVGSANQLIQGNVLSVSPDGGTVVVTDPSRQTVSLVVNGSVSAYTGGIGTHAQWSPDSTTVYVTTTGNTLLTHSTFTNWTSTPIAPSSDTVYNDVAVMVPSVGAYFAGASSTDGRSYCPTTTITTPGTPPVTNNVIAPLAGQSAAITDRLAATNDGLHILGASVATGMSDIYVNPSNYTPPTGQAGPAICTFFNGTTHIGAPTTFSTTNNAAVAFSTVGVTPATITGVVPSSNSALAFVTYNGTSGKLPYYTPVATGPTGTLHSLTLSTAGGTPVAPVAGVFSSDNFTFFAATSGDNLIHLITLTYPTGSTPTLTDSSQIAPTLPNATGTGVATPNLIAQHPKRITS